jgi:hypothetical protein
MVAAFCAGALNALLRARHRARPEPHQDLSPAELKARDRWFDRQTLK